jgi:hypothetical protein
VAASGRSSAEHEINDNLHFIVLGEVALRPHSCRLSHPAGRRVQVDGHLYELDGRKQRPINHGPYASPSHDTAVDRACRAAAGGGACRVTDVLRDAVRVVRQFMVPLLAPSRLPPCLSFVPTAPRTQHGVSWPARRCSRDGCSMQRWPACGWAQPAWA